MKNTNELMKRLIEKVLSYSKNTNFEIKYSKIMLNDLIEEVANRFPMSENVLIDAKADLMEIYFSEIALKQILNNLFENAVKYCDKPICEISVACHADESFITVSVADNGPGIEAMYHKEIFKPFNRLNKDSDVDGIGIGLAMVKKIAEKTYVGVSLNSTISYWSHFKSVI